jgi:zinc/manganese transport system substrate-binding protein
MKMFKSIQYQTLFAAFAVFVILFTGAYAEAKVRIVTSLPDFAAIAREIGGDKVDVEALAKGYQDPHFVDAKPIYVTKLNRADVLIYNGLDLEIGWLPPLVTGSRNSKIATLNSPGNVDASRYIGTVLEIPTTPVDRSMGDVHSRGNPHYLLDPRNGIYVARGIAAKLSEIDPENASYYEENFKRFSDALELKIKEWETELAPYRGTEIVTYHKLWIYFKEWAGFEVAGTIEPKPGISPSPSHVASLIKEMEVKHVRLIIAGNYYPEKTAKLIAEKTGAAFLSLPAEVEGRDGIKTYSELFDVIVSEITSVLKEKTGAANDHLSNNEG